MKFDAEISSSDLQRKGRKTLNCVEFLQQKIAIIRHGRVCAVLVPAQDIEKLEAFENSQKEE